MAISIHTPAKGATQKEFLLIYEFLFQSTHPRRVRLHEPGFLQCRRQISIHTPAKGATLSIFRSFAPSSKFQSTHPRRVRRLGCLRSSSMSLNFNPHTREGCDFPKKPDYRRENFISIHTPAKGATLSICAPLKLH